MGRLTTFFCFGIQQALACLFPAVIFLTLLLSKYVSIPGIYRYDLILIACIMMQVIMLIAGLETIDELKVITMFHLIGLALELYKVHMGSWSYPEQAWTKLYGVPLYSGFMYASVASYICQAWKRFHLKITGWPRSYLTIPLSAAIYLNFFVHHFLYDFRWVLTLLLFIIFVKTTVSFEVNRKMYSMHMIVSYFLIAFFIWIAENISTLLGAWRYPNQQSSWHLVHWGKISSWFLLVIISVIIVVQLKHMKEHLQQANNFSLPTKLF